MERTLRPMFFGWLLAAALAVTSGLGCFGLGPNVDCTLDGADCAAETATSAPAAAPTSTPAPVVAGDCNDGIDNDGDGEVDLNDPGCDSASDDSETDEGETLTPTPSDETEATPEPETSEPTSPEVTPTPDSETEATPEPETSEPTSPEVTPTPSGTQTLDGCVETADGVEYCDGVDNDCDGSVDNVDFDGDGYISDDCTQYTGDDPQGRLTGDCADEGGYRGWIHTSLIHPGQLEFGDWVDADCDGVKDDGCTALACDSDGNGTENYERDGDAAFECVDGFFVADLSCNTSGDCDPLDDTLVWKHQEGTEDVQYSDVAVSCDASAEVERNPAMWDSILDLQYEMCDRTPAIAGWECIALFY